MRSHAGPSSALTQRKLKKKQAKHFHSTKVKRVNEREELEALDRLAMEFVSEAHEFNNRLRRN